MPADAAELDVLLRNNDETALALRLRQVSTAQDLLLNTNWEQHAVYQGAGFIVSYQLMVDLWHLAEAQPDQNNDETKENSALFFLYTLDLIMTDGPKCQDDTAPGHRADQVFFENRSVLRYLMTLPVPERMLVGTASLHIESATAALRQNDTVLCSDGLAEFKAAMAADAQHIPAPAGAVGKSYVYVPPGYQPGFVAPAQWQPKQAQARANLPDFLTHFLSQPSAP
jgi:hypothetical protein